MFHEKKDNSKQEFRGYNNFFITNFFKCLIKYFIPLKVTGFIKQHKKDDFVLSFPCSFGLYLTYVFLNLSS